MQRRQRNLIRTAAVTLESEKSALLAESSRPARARRSSQPFATPAAVTAATAEGSPARMRAR